MILLAMKLMAAFKAMCAGIAAFEDAEFEVVVVKVGHYENDVKES